MMSSEKTLSEKIVITVYPVEEGSAADQSRIGKLLEDRGYGPVHFPLPVLRKLYPMARTEDPEGKNITLSLVHEDDRVVITDIQEGDTTGKHYGIAVDYGSTTMIFKLIDMNTKEPVCECREVNRQRAYGLDILTRIVYGLEGEAHREDLRKATLETLEAGLQTIFEKSGVRAEDCPAMVISGNTTMIHFLLGLDAWTVFSSPYAPVTTVPGFRSGSELGLHFPGEVFMMPSASNYIGGDIVSGLLTIDLAKSEDIRLFFDIGTNGELVLGNREFLLAGAGAAGPALEGDVSKHGTLACPGAVDTVKIRDGILSCTTIDNEKPVGICGSGIMDLVAEMRLAGWINIAGQLDPEATDRIIRVVNDEEQREEYAVVFADSSESASGEQLYFSQTDIDRYIEAKAAAHTMIDCLLDASGLEASDLGHMYLSGAFCTHANLESAITVGVFPDLPRDRYTVLPNSSLEGAVTLLLDRFRMEDIRSMLDSIVCVQFASMPDFMIRMNAAKFIPHTNMEEYPSIREKLEKK